MQSFLQNSPKYAPAIVRIGMSLVFVWFGFNQMLHPAAWTGYVPDSITALFGGNSTLLVLFNGWFEIVGGLTLLLGLQVRLVSFLLGVHLFVISSSLGMSALAIRDYGLSIATISILFAGPDVWSTDKRLLAENTEETVGAQG